MSTPFPPRRFRDLCPAVGTRPGRVRGGRHRRLSRRARVRRRSARGRPGHRPRRRRLPRPGGAAAARLARAGTRGAAVAVGWLERRAGACGDLRRRTRRRRPQRRPDPMRGWPRPRRAHLPGRGVARAGRPHRRRGAAPARLAGHVPRGERAAGAPGVVPAPAGARRRRAQRRTADPPPGGAAHGRRRAAHRDAGTGRGPRIRCGRPLRPQARRRRVGADGRGRGGAARPPALAGARRRPAPATPARRPSTWGCGSGAGGW